MPIGSGASSRKALRMASRGDPRGVGDLGLGTSNTTSSTTWTSGAAASPAFASVSALVFASLVFASATGELLRRAGPDRCGLERALREQLRLPQPCEPLCERQPAPVIGLSDDRRYVSERSGRRSTRSSRRYDERRSSRRGSSVNCSVLVCLVYLGFAKLSVGYFASICFMASAAQFWITTF